MADGPSVSGRSLTPAGRVDGGRPPRRAVPPRASGRRLPSPGVARRTRSCCCGTAAVPTSATSWRRWPPGSPGSGTAGRSFPTGGPTTPVTRARSSCSDSIDVRTVRPPAGSGGDPGRIVLAGWSLGANAAAAVAERPGDRRRVAPGRVSSDWPAPTTGRPSTDARRGRSRSGGAAGRHWWPTGRTDPVVPVAGSVAGAGRTGRGRAGGSCSASSTRTMPGIIGTAVRPLAGAVRADLGPGRGSPCSSAVARAVAALALGPD